MTALARLAALADENVFKVRAYEKAHDILNSLDPQTWERTAAVGAWAELPGIGKGLASIIQEILESGECRELARLKSLLPPGLEELCALPGLGVKKARLLIDELHVTSLSELEYAINENRLVSLKGFGQKTQDRLAEAIRMQKSYLGKCLLSDAVSWVERFLKDTAAQAASPPFAQWSDSFSDASGTTETQSDPSPLLITPLGDLRKLREIISTIELGSPPQSLQELQHRLDAYCAIPAQAPPVSVKLIPLDTAALNEDAVFFADINTVAPPSKQSIQSERVPAVGDWASFLRHELSKFEERGLLWVPPVLREGENLDFIRERYSRPAQLREQSPAHSNQTPRRLGAPVKKQAPNSTQRNGPPDLSWKLRGVFHNHTTRSDGGNSAKEMALEASRLGLEYIGISDHSQSAFYARGLKPEELQLQKAELAALLREAAETSKSPKSQNAFPQIFWGVESDILADGSLDYPEETLSEFDFVVASVHSRFKMDRNTMTERILNAIQNPYTTCVGHLTGRILLGRSGYDLDVPAILKAAAQHSVAVELNAHPSRLDIDWRWGSELRKAGTYIVINPDAHEVAGLGHYRYGEWMAKKAGLEREQILNTLGLKEVTEWLIQRKKGGQPPPK